MKKRSVMLFSLCLILYQIKAQKHLNFLRSKYMCINRLLYLYSRKPLKMCRYCLLFLLYFLCYQTSIAQSPTRDSLWLNLLPSFPAYAQSNHPKFKRLTPNEGLSQGHVTAIVKDHQGFMWFGTDEGLNKYDGYTFTSYKNDAEKPESISNNFVRDAIEDHAGNIWVATTSGLDKFNRKEATFIHYTPAGKSIYIEGIFEDSQKRMWIGSNEGLYLFHPDKGTFHLYPHREKDFNSLSHNGIYQIVEDNEGDLWISTQDGLNRFNPQTQQFIHYRHDPLDKNSIGSSWVTTLYKDSKGRIWAGTLGGGISLFDNKKNVFVNFRHDPANPNSVAHNDILSLVEDSDGKLWIGTENGGISVFDYNENKFVNYRNEVSDNTSLSNNSVHSLYKDDIGNIWAGTWSGGVNFLPRFGDKFAHYQHIQGNPNSISHNIVTTITGDSNGNIWMGTDGGGINVLDRKKKTITLYQNNPKDRSSIKSNYIITTTIVSTDILGIGYHRLGFDLLNSKTGHITHLPEDTGDKQGTPLASTTGTVAHNDLWLGTYYGFGLFHYNRATKQFTRYQHDPLDKNSIAEGSIFSLFEDREGNVWVGMGLNDGLDFFDRKNNRFIHHRHDPRDSNSISNDIVFSITDDREGNIWIGTDNGLNCYDKKTKRFRSYTEKNGLANNVIYGILEDRHGNLWLSSNKGISKFNPVTSTCRNYDVSDGLQDNTFKQNAWYQTEQGEMFFGGINGFNLFHPDSIRDNPFIPPVWITDFQIFNKPVVIGENSPLRQHITQSKEITLSHEQSVFTFAFAALNYTQPEKNEYAYKLEGFDKDWNYVGARRTATYTNLDARDYIFRVKASNNDGIWNEQGVSIIIHILPPWWKTLWFRIAVGLGIVGLGISFYWLRIRAIENQNRKLEKLVGMRTKELQIANLEIQKSNEELVLMEKSKENMLSVMSHEIRTPLNSMIGLTHVLKRRSPRPDQIEIIDTLKTSGDHLLHLVNDVLDYNKIQARKLDLEILPFNLIDTFKQLHSMFTRAAEEKNILFSAQISTSLPALLAGDPTRLLQILSNLLSNAIKFTSEGAVTLYARTKDQSEQICTIEFKVEDTGIGIPADKLHVIYEPFSQLGAETHRQYGGSGLGLLIVKNLVEAMKGTVTFESTPGKGTTFTVVIPFAIECASETYDQNNNQPKLSILKGLQILYTEDVKSNQFLVKTLLADHEINCDIANDGEETIAKISEKEFDVILLDVQLPDMDGFELTTKIRNNAQSKNSKTPIILFSAHTGINDEKIKSCGANDFIGKPFQPDDLLLKIERNVNGSQ
jgi:signal transduction histidine kinase/ligand-binding sensor domain-containing protein/CheY-like chemotaxis protein